MNILRGLALFLVFLAGGRGGPHVEHATFMDPAFLRNPIFVFPTPVFVGFHTPVFGRSL